MAEANLKLLGMWASPFVMRVRIALEQKGISYEYHEEDIHNNKSELLLKHNPIHKKVPTLIHDDRSICESLVILQYLDENWSSTGPNLLPSDPYERAMARFWAACVDEKLLIPCVGIAKTTTEEAKSEKVAVTLAALEQFEGAFKKCFGGKDYFGGDSIGFVDVTLGSVLIWIKTVENISGVKLLDEAKVPLLVEWANRFLAVDFVKLVIPSVEKLAEYARVLQATRWKVISAK